MALRIKAIGTYRPRIDQGNTVQKPEFVRYASRATGLVEATLDQSIKEMRDQLIDFLRAGRAVKIEGLGTWTPNIALDGTFSIMYRADSALVKGLNIPGMFTGTISNRENIGKTADELVQLWNEKNPEDQVVSE
ncbi:MAG: hypothetical protein C3F07_19190 [Anaerolineales bacterium]|nr:MAG: hypothetical protein C3F07_19190 [Anaerolineales bacterium]